MMNEEMKRTMQFIVEQQAQFAVNQQLADERISRLETNMAEMTRAHTAMTGAMAEMAHAQIKTAQAQAETAQTLAQMGRAQTHLNEVVAAMLDTHKQTEERLDAFIVVLERYISENRNGNSDKNSAA